MTQLPFLINSTYSLFERDFKVKRFFLLTGAFIILISTSDLGQSINTGIKVGLNSATIGGEYTNGLNLQSITTFNAGVFAKFDIVGLLAVQPELLYNLKGYKFTHPLETELSPTPGPNVTTTGNSRI